ncbi:MAG: AAA family ATPase, partial [Gammaproteobacteria bacterium]|nr:AAA family ATPase [Gammaproteobacteria bacterium]
DAAALRRSDRARFRRLAADLGLPFLVLACVASRATRLARIARRRAEADDPSDADESVLELQLATMQPIEDDERAHVVEIDTEDPTAPARAQAAIRQCRAIAARLPRDWRAGGSDAARAR